jgi:hypothetical protein
VADDGQKLSPKSEPIAAGAVAGPAGTAGYEAVELRSWIKRHIFHLKPHQPKKVSRKN